MSPSNYVTGQFGDTTYTKVFVGGLAWETQKDTMRKYFEQFGDILEAVVITDKNTGRSKGYGFVTFRDPESAMRSCVDPAPVIDGRRANCNLASLGVQRSKLAAPLPPGSRNFSAVKGLEASGLQGGMGTAFTSHASTFPHYAIQHGMPYNVYGYSPYSSEYTYPTGYYNVYGGAAGQYPPVYGGASTGMVAGASSYYPYLQYGMQGSAATPVAYSQGYAMQYHQMLQYPAVASPTGLTGFNAQMYGGPVSLAPNLNAQAVSFTLKQA